MKFRHSPFLTFIEEETDLEFQITPMIDLLLVLLIFFMAITTTKILRNDTSLQLPHITTKQSQVENEQMGQCVINIAWREKEEELTFSIDQIPARTLPELNAILNQNYRAFQKVHPEKSYEIVIRAEEKLPYHFLQNILQLCQKSGFRQITFAAIPQPTTN
ncbi:MAG: biopolymer transporter ExbD [Verrucomicrobiae bacterium]|nr:biopolymer transporter ExbD [Verrucomicrobiae bacterium]